MTGPAAASESVRDLYVAKWGAPLREAVFGSDVPIGVNKWVADGVTLYATIGASDWSAVPDDHHRVEFFIGLEPERDDVARALAHLAHYAVTAGVEVAHGHTVPMPGSLWTGTGMRRLLVLRPKSGFLEPLELPGGAHVVFLQAIPLYDTEQELLAEIGVDAFMNRWSEMSVPFWDATRPASV